MEWTLLPTFCMVMVIFVTLLQLQRRQSAVDRKLTVLLRHFNIEGAAALGLSDKVKELARDPAKKIEAIKVHREETGVGLAEAKEAVEAFIDGK